MASFDQETRAPDHFVFGSERAGTTLLSAMVSAHPDAYTLNDSSLFLAAAESWSASWRRPWRRAAAKSVWIAKDSLRRIAPLHSLLVRARGSMAGGYRPEVPDLKGLPGLGETLSPAAVRTLLDRLGQRYRQYQPGEKAASFLLDYAQQFDASPSIAAVREVASIRVEDLLAVLFTALLPADVRSLQRLGEKTPRHVYCADWMRELFPDARFVTLVRNPLANIASLHSRMKGDLTGAIAKYRSFHEGPAAALYDASASLVVRFEDLVAEPTATMSRVYRDLGLAEHLTAAPGATTRGAYIGSAIDPERDRARLDYFRATDRTRILDECAVIVDRHYPDLGG